MREQGRNSEPGLIILEAEVRGELSEILRKNGISSEEKRGAPAVLNRGDILAVNLYKFRELYPAVEYRARTEVALELLKKLGFLKKDQTLADFMQGAVANGRLVANHESKPFKAEALIHNAGNQEYLLNGFVILGKFAE